MKLVTRTLIFHLVCIIAFSYVYLYLSNDFKSNIEKFSVKHTYLDYFLLSTTIQAGVGVTDLIPITNTSKVAVIIQQFLMIMTYVISLYVFTL